MDIQNVLASRYASPRMCRIWSAENKIIAERRLWLAVMEAQRDLGVDFGGDDPDQMIADYTAVVDHVDLDSIADRERITRHDVKARIEEFNGLVGHEHVHKGMTSRDLTENVEQMQVLDKKKHVIPGLYAAGNNSGSYYANDYCMTVMGNSHGRAYTFGYLAGKHIMQEGS